MVYAQDFIMKRFLFCFKEVQVIKMVLWYFYLWFGIECTQNIPIETLVIKFVRVLVETPKCKILLCLNTQRWTFLFRLQVVVFLVCLHRISLDHWFNLHFGWNTKPRKESWFNQQSNQTKPNQTRQTPFSRCLFVSLTHSLLVACSRSISFSDSWFSLFLPRFVLNHTPKVLERTTNFYTYSLLLCLSFFSSSFFLAAWFWWNKFWCFVYFIRSMFSISWYFIFLRMCVCMCMCGFLSSVFILLLSLWLLCIRF